MEPIKTFLRLKPSEQTQSNESYLVVSDDNEVLLTPPPNSRSKEASKYKFTGVFEPTVPQSEVFEKTCLPLVVPVLRRDNFNALLFAYGISNSGKTHSIIGSNQPGQAGVLPRALAVIFRSIEQFVQDSGEAAQYRPLGFQDVETIDTAVQDARAGVESIMSQHRVAADAAKKFGITLKDLPRPDDADIDNHVVELPDGMDYAVWISCAELYTEKIYDLLAEPPGSVALGISSIDPKRPALDLRTDISGQKYVHGLREIKVKTLDEALLVLQVALAQRRISTTLLNEASSRSHCIFTIKILKTPQFGNSAAESAALGKTSVSRLSIVDLAGSERMRNTKSCGQRLKEAANINSSLMYLRQCIEILKANQRPGSKNRQPVPYQHSKLTQLFQSALDEQSVNSRICMIVNANPWQSDYDETKNALRFSSAAMDVSTATLKLPGANNDSTSIQRMSRTNNQASPVLRISSPLGMSRFDKNLSEANKGFGQGILISLLYSQIEDLREQLKASEIRFNAIEAEERKAFMDDLTSRILTSTSIQQVEPMETIDDNRDGEKLAEKARMPEATSRAVNYEDRAVQVSHTNSLVLEWQNSSLQSSKAAPWSRDDEVARLMRALQLSEERRLQAQQELREAKDAIASWQRWLEDCPSRKSIKPVSSVEESPDFPAITESLKSTPSPPAIATTSMDCAPSQDAALNVCKEEAEIVDAAAVGMRMMEAIQDTEEAAVAQAIRDEEFVEYADLATSPCDQELANPAIDREEQESSTSSEERESSSEEDHELTNDNFFDCMDNVNQASTKRDDVSATEEVDDLNISDDNQVHSTEPESTVTMDETAHFAHQKIAETCVFGHHSDDQLVDSLTEHTDSAVPHASASPKTRTSFRLIAVEIPVYTSPRRFSETRASTEPHVLPSSEPTQPARARSISLPLGALESNNQPSKKARLSEMASLITASHAVDHETCQNEGDNEDQDDTVWASAQRSPDMEDYAISDTKYTIDDHINTPLAELSPIRSLYPRLSPLSPLRHQSEGFETLEHKQTQHAAEAEAEVVKEAIGIGHSTTSVDFDRVGESSDVQEVEGEVAVVLQDADVVALVTKKRKRKLRSKNAVMEEEMEETIGIPPALPPTRGQKKGFWKRYLPFEMNPSYHGPVNTQGRCRMLLYKGRQPIQLAHLLTKPAHSIINQSFSSKTPLDGKRFINGDGFGVGWYESEQKCTSTLSSSSMATAPAAYLTDSDSSQAAPCIFTSVTPAWNNMNLIRLADKIKSSLIFAHIKRKVQEFISDEIFHNVNGNTASEWAFAVFLSQLANPQQPEPFCRTTLKDAMLKTIQQLNILSKQAGIQEPSTLNFAVTDGVTVMCTRYINSNSSTAEAEGLYLSSGTKFECYQPGHYKMIKEAAKSKREDIVVMASEPLTFEESDWSLVPRNTVVVVTERMNVLMYPIMDEYHEIQKLDVQKSQDTAAAATSENETMTNTRRVAIIAGGRRADGARDTQNREVVFVQERHQENPALPLSIHNQDRHVITSCDSSFSSSDSSQSSNSSGNSSSPSTPLMSPYASSYFQPSPPSSTLSSSPIKPAVSGMIANTRLSIDTKMVGSVFEFPRRDSGNADSCDEDFDHGRSERHELEEQENCNSQDSEDSEDSEIDEDYRIFPVRPWASLAASSSLMRERSGRI
ncbi:hypothetical protein EDD11_005949 [Mortierella claussenii]|nr:hypothetical protein EDD11_005949 [Mortierella claussenii]